MSNVPFDARAVGPDLSFLDRLGQGYGAQGVCTGCKFRASTVFVSPDKENQALLQGKTEHPTPLPPDHVIIYELISGV